MEYINDTEKRNKKIEPDQKPKIQQREREIENIKQPHKNQTQINKKTNQPI